MNRLPDIRAVSAIWRLATAAVLVTVIGTGAVEDAFATSRVCQQLQAQARESATPSSARVKRELARALEQADRRGCLAGSLFRHRGGGRRCALVLSRIERLDQMMTKAARPSRNPAWAQRELRRNGCIKDSSTRSVVAAKEPTDGFRTVCVRSCDGYFFPLGFSQSTNDFERDGKICKGIYGDASAEVYRYPSHGSPEDMVSLDGEAYAKQSFAFIYRREFRSSCQVGLQGGLTRVRDAFMRATAAQKIPVPVPRPTEDLASSAQGDVSTNPPKTVSRIVLSLPIYSGSGLRAGHAGEKDPQGISAVSQILKLLVPPARAEQTVSGSQQVVPDQRRREFE
jgi:hypothetical protein